VRNNNDSELKNLKDWVEDYGSSELPIIYQKIVDIKPPTTIKILKSTEELRFHQKTLDLLKIPAVVSIEQLREIDKTEERIGIKLPPSIKEWYSLLESNNVLGGFTINYINTLDDFDIDETGMILIMTENQGLLQWKITSLDEDDPFITQYFSSGEIHHTKETFSEFIHFWIVDGFNFI